MPKPKLPKLTFAQLATIEWLVEKPNDRCMVIDGSHLRSEFPSYCELVDGKITVVADKHNFNVGDRGAAAKFQDRLGGSTKVSMWFFTDNKLLAVNYSSTPTKPDKELNNYYTFMERHGGSLFVHGPSTLLRANQATIEWWNETGKKLFEPLKEKREATRQAAKRRIVIGVVSEVPPSVPDRLKGKLPEKFIHPVPTMRLMRPTFVATVVRETEDRLYVQDIQRIRPSAAWHERESNPVSGNAPNSYVLKNMVMADGISSDIPRHMLKVDQERYEEYGDLCEQTIVAVLPTLLNLHDRLFQAQAMNQDLMTEAVEKEKETPQSPSI
jgi:hypothetical protein